MVLYCSLLIVLKYSFNSSQIISFSYSRKLLTTLFVFNCRKLREQILLRTKSGISDKSVCFPLKSIYFPTQPKQIVDHESFLIIVNSFLVFPESHKKIRSCFEKKFWEEKIEIWFSFLLSVFLNVRVFPEPNNTNFLGEHAATAYRFAIYTLKECQENQMVLKTLHCWNSPLWKNTGFKALILVSIETFLLSKKQSNKNHWYLFE